MSRSYSSRAAFLSAVLSIFVFSAAAEAEKPPRGHDGMLVYLADGAYDPTSPHPRIPGCGAPIPGQCDPDYFHRNVMQRDEAAYQANRAEAVAFFIRRFGIDVDDPANLGRVTFNPFFLDPRARYRVHSISDRNVPPNGYRVLDGGWQMVVVDPDGYDLGGEFAGIHLPAGGFASFGDYLIEAPGEPIHIRYQALKPIVTEPDGTFKFQCEIFHDELGVGRAMGLGDFEFLPDGRVKQFGRNILTFPRQ